MPCFNASNVVKGGIRMQESSAKLKVCTQTVPSGGRTAGYHRRSAVSFYLVTDGCVHILLQGREITVRENEGAFVNSGVLHSGIPQDCIYQCIVFDMNTFLKNNPVCGEYIQKILHQETMLFPHFSDEHPQILNCISVLFDAMYPAAAAAVGALGAPAGL